MCSYSGEETGSYQEAQDWDEDAYATIPCPPPIEAEPQSEILKDLYVLRDSMQKQIADLDRIIFSKII